jgi:2-polyprenyl-3-methyl-5-hydroxy-6-metoxy-1,4-benzoquinol methylase
MGGCCSSHSYDEFFTEKTARRDARGYRRRGLDSTSRRMVGFLARRGVGGATVLDVGGGIGAIGLELLRAGAARALTVELSGAYDETAAELARQAEAEGRVERRVADFAQEAADLPRADVVIMHRVVCCYPDHDSLLAAAAGRAERLLVFSFPRSTWWTRAGSKLVNVILGQRGCDFRSFIHPPHALIAAGERHGFRLEYQHEGSLWRVAGFERST